MRRLIPSSLLSILLFSAFSQRALAEGYVFFQAAPMSANSSVPHNAGPGEALELGCDLTQGLDCTWQVAAFYQVLDGGAFSWAIELGTTTTQDEEKFIAGSIEVQQSLLSIDITPPSFNLDGGLLVSTAASTGSSVGAPAGLYNLFNFILTKQKSVVNYQVSNLYAAVGPVEFGGNDQGGFGFYEVVHFGPNTPVPGYNSGPWPYGAFPLPVITVTNTPEPTVLFMVGFVTIYFVRRR